MFHYKVFYEMRNNFFLFFISSRRRHTRFDCDWSSDVCSSDLELDDQPLFRFPALCCEREFCPTRRVLPRAAQQTKSYSSVLFWKQTKVLKKAKEALPCQYCTELWARRSCARRSLLSPRRELNTITTR